MSELIIYSMKVITQIDLIAIARTNAVISGSRYEASQFFFDLDRV